MKEFRTIVFALAMTMLASCGTYKRLGYLQDMQPDITYDMPSQPDAVISKGDILNISVFSGTPALAVPFNISTGISAVDPVGDGTVDTRSASPVNGYEVDKEGNITFPVFGKIPVEGKTPAQLKDYLESEMVNRKYMKDPVVQVNFANFTFTMIGEVGSGIYNVPTGRINILDAFAMAGEPTEDAVRNEICVIRTRDGNRRMYTIDLTSKDCFYSPVFFLQQNDIVYVKPMNGKHDSTVGNRFSMISTVTTIVSTIVNICLWIKLYGIGE